MIRRAVPSAAGSTPLVRQSTSLVLPSLVLPVFTCLGLSPPLLSSPSSLFTKPYECPVLPLLIYSVALFPKSRVQYLDVSIAFVALPLYANMSRSGDKAPVGFGTHITAGGIAGGMEAVSISSSARMMVLMVLSS
jgi:hypothetical protein